MTAANIAVVLLAAGQSRRMGQDKLLKTLPNGKSLLEDRIRMIAATGVTPFVALPENSQRTRLLETLPAVVVPVKDQTLGLGHSLSTAVAAIPAQIDGIMVMLCDLPDLTSNDLSAMMAQFDGSSILRGASEDGIPGHPVIFPMTYRTQLMTITGDKGAQDVLQNSPVTLHRLPGQNAVLDLDTPEDWAEWEKETVRSPRK
ncbi:CTP:molybdopterin cytidylyltransferase MocA [Aliiroseovarius halocynthiae]|uniref:Nucleotidyltransferase family protein n=1 Tax=Aliiroseovarius halocynthiae TaxID=985055 RepID=A0A545SW12_9RHOB|nr:nucleotidyltransferase family protein [Aliiroseovarius halocynthiae]TQV69153.1 nucleotidyltransferase family protein [Aliiroseovarius halocynthiae]SMR71913.1 CTP:molybdopterin cytidylyltransferase MocA [Aliiroseovarius halocynthiae]